MNQTEEQSIATTEKTEVDFSGFVSGCDYFTERVSFPEGLKGNELETALLTQLEGMSPFNSDQLSWGAFIDRDANQALIYAALTSTVERKEDASEHFLNPLFPSFLPFLGYIAEKECILCAVNCDTLSLLVYDQPGGLPKEVHTVSSGGVEITPDLAERMQADLLRDLPWIKLPTEDKIYYYESLKWNWKHQITTHSRESGGGIVELTLDRSQIYLADTRAQPVKRKAFGNSRLNLVLWLTTAGSLALMVLILLLSGIKWIWDGQIDKKMIRVESQQERVALIEAKNRNLAIFESGTSGRLQPLAMLDIINRHRPDGLFFSEVKAFEGNRIQIEGVAESNGTELVNQFRDQMKSINVIKESNVDITRIAQGATYFRCLAEFGDLELADVGAYE